MWNLPMPRKICGWSAKGLGLGEIFSQGLEWEIQLVLGPCSVLQFNFSSSADPLLQFENLEWRSDYFTYLNPNISNFWTHFLHQSLHICFNQLPIRILQNLATITWIDTHFFLIGLPFQYCFPWIASCFQPDIFSWTLAHRLSSQSN